MVMGILTRLASFSLRNPKTVAFIVLGVVLASFAVHYKVVLGKNEELRVERAAHQETIAAHERREAIFAEDARIAAAATKDAIAQREEARAALEALRRGREADPEAVAWGAQLIPLGEVARLCVALPEMDGCPDTVPNN